MSSGLPKSLRTASLKKKKKKKEASTAFYFTPDICTFGYV